MAGMGRRGRSARWVAALVVPLLFVTWGLLWHGPVSGDLTFLFAPNMAWLRSQWLTGELPLWNPLLLGGQPFVAELQTQAFYPPAALFLLPVGVALGPYLVGHLVWFALGVHRLARWSGASRAASVVAALAAGLSPLSVEHYPHANMLCGLAWIPWCWAWARLAAKRPSRRVVAGLAAVVACSVLAGSPEATLWGLAGAAVVPWRRWKGLAVAAVLGAGLAGVTLLPFLELLRESERAGGVAVDDLSRFALMPRELVDLLLPFARYDGGAVQHFQAVVFVGVGTWALALAGLRRHRGWLVLMAAALVLSLGDATPAFGGWLELVPGARMFRYPIKFLTPLCVVLGLGVAFELSRLERRPGDRAWAPILALAAALLGGAGGLHLGGKGLLVSAGWAAAVAGALVLAGRAPTVARPRAVAVVLVFEARVFQAGVGTLAAGKGRAACVPSPAFRPVGRVHYDLDFDEAWRFPSEACEVGVPNTNEAGGWAAVEGVVTPAPRTAFNDPSRPLARSAVGTVVTLRGAPLQGEVIFENERFVAVRLASPGPRALVEVNGVDQALEPQSESASRLEFLLPPGARRLTLFDTAYPGWRAEVDGVSVPVSSTAGGEREVTFAPGASRLVWAYRPWSFRLGGVLSLGSLVVWLWLWRRVRAPAVGELR